MVNSKKTFQWIQLGIILLIVLVAVVLRFYALDERPLLGTENINYFYAVDSVSEIVTPPPAHGQFMIPFMRVLLHFVFTWNPGLVTFRLVSVLFGILGVMLMYVVARRFFGAWPGLIAAALLAISPAHIFQSQLTKFYTIMAALTLGTLYFAERMTKRPNIANGIGLGILSLFSILNHLFGVFEVFGAMMFIVLILLIDKTSTSTLDHKKIFKMTMVAVAIMIIGYLPYVPILFRTFFFNEEITVGSGGMYRFYYDLGFFKDIFSYFGTGPGGGFWFCFSLFAIGLAACIAIKNKAGLLVITHILTPFSILILAKPGHPFDVEHVFFMLPIFLMFVAYGIFVVAEQIGKAFVGKIRQAVTSAVVVLLIGAALIFGSTYIWGYYDVHYLRTFRAAAHLELARIGLKFGNENFAAFDIPMATRYAKTYTINKDRLELVRELPALDQMVGLIRETVPETIETNALRQIQFDESTKQKLFELLQKNETNAEFFKRTEKYFSDRSHFSLMFRDLGTHRLFSGGRSDKLLQEAVILGEKERYDEMIPLLQKAIQETPDRPDILIALGLAQSMAGDVVTARASIMKALNMLDKIFAYTPQKVDGMSQNYREKVSPFENDRIGYIDKSLR